MSGWGARKVVWSRVGVQPDGAGWVIALDARRLMTPAKAAMVLPRRALADLVAGEWAAQRGLVAPRSMPVTRMANSAIDKVAPQRAAVAALLAEYGGSDLLCYRAPAPVALQERQALVWDPLLDWVAGLGAPLRTGRGIMPVPQDPAALAVLAARVHALNPFPLTALHDLVAISGSLVLALAVAAGHLSAPDAWAASRLDEDWQAELWGPDAEAQDMARRKQADFLLAAQFFILATRPDTASV